MLLDTLGLLTFQIAMIGWILGTLWTLLEPFYWKIRKGELTWADFDYVYFVNFFSTLLIGVFLGLLVFEFWTIPAGADWVAFVIAFLTAAGLDDTVLKELFKWTGLYERIKDRYTTTG